MKILHPTQLPLPGVPPQTALVIGGSGFVGKHLVATLLREGISVLAPTHAEFDLLDPPNLEAALGTLELATNLHVEPKAITSIFHVAGNSRMYEAERDPVMDLRQNVEGTLRLLEWARLAWQAFPFEAKPKFVYLGSLLAGRVATPYANSKLAAHAYVELYKRRGWLPTCIVAPGSVYGPGSTKGPIHDLIKGFVSDGSALTKIYAPHGWSSGYAFAYVENVARTLCNAIRFVSEGGSILRMHNRIESLESARHILRQLTDRDPAFEMIVPMDDVPAPQGSLDGLPEGMCEMCDLSIGLARTLIHELQLRGGVILRSWLANTVFDT